MGPALRTPACGFLRACRRRGGLRARGPARPTARRRADDAAPAVQRAAACLRRLRGAPALRLTASPLGAGSSSSGGGRAKRGEGGRRRGRVGHGSRQVWDRWKA